MKYKLANLYSFNWKDWFMGAPILYLTPSSLSIILLVVAIGLTLTNHSSNPVLIKWFSIFAVLFVILSLLLRIVFSYVKANFKIGILAYGSILHDPGKEILENTLTKIDIITPFLVEYGRTSSLRAYAPSLTPVEKQGSPINAKIIVLNPKITEKEVYDIFYRRILNFVGETSVKFPTKGDDQFGSIIKTLNNFKNVKKVLYAVNSVNIEEIEKDNISIDIKAKKLAYLAIESLNKETFCFQRDGIKYLIENIKHGAQTPLTPLYTQEILKRSGNAITLEAARLIIAQKKGIFPKWIEIKEQQTF